MRRKISNMLIQCVFYQNISMAHVLNNGWCRLSLMPAGDFHEGFPQQRR
jgi:hypothetical protein